MASEWQVSLDLVLFSGLSFALFMILSWSWPKIFLLKCRAHFQIMVPNLLFLYTPVELKQLHCLQLKCSTLTLHESGIWLKKWNGPEQSNSLCCVHILEGRKSSSTVFHQKWQKKYQACFLNPHSWWTDKVEKYSLTILLQFLWVLWYHSSNQDFLPFCNLSKTRLMCLLKF